MKKEEIAKEKRIGEERLNKNGSLMRIVEYNNWNDIHVEFEKGNRVHTGMSNFHKGNVKNVYDRTVYGVGYLGEGPYIPYISKGIDTPQYRSWKAMLERCYSGQAQKKRPTYIGCTVVEEWHNFQTFSKWFDENYYEVSDDMVCLDKDILIKGNKVYSSVTCVFVPSRINTLFVARNSARGELPIGVYYDKEKKKYKAQCQHKGKYVGIGEYNSIEAAFIAYKLFKENYIKEVAEEYKHKVPHKLYKALIEYEVEYND